MSLDGKKVSIEGMGRCLRALLPLLTLLKLGLP